MSNSQQGWQGNLIGNLSDVPNSCAEFFCPRRSPAPEECVITGNKDLFVPGNNAKYGDFSIYESFHPYGR